LPLQLRVGKTLALNFITKTYEEELAIRGKSRGIRQSLLRVWKNHYISYVWLENEIKIKT